MEDGTGFVANGSQVHPQRGSHPPVKQVISSADALMHGAAYRDTALTKLIPRVESVIPCVVCFETSPLRFPVALEVEDAISAKVGGHPFQCESGRFPVQIFDVEGVETFGDLFGLPSEWELLLNAIASRSSAPHLRYKPLSRDGGIMVGGEHEGSSVLPKMVEAAHEASSKRWHELTSQE